MQKNAVITTGSGPIAHAAHSNADTTTDTREPFASPFASTTQRLPGG